MPLRLTGALIALSLWVLTPAVWAKEVGVIAAFEGDVQIGRGGTWFPATLGAAVEEGDELHTGEGHLTLLLEAAPAAGSVTGDGSGACDSTNVATAARALSGAVATLDKHSDVSVEPSAKDWAKLKNGAIKVIEQIGVFGVKAWLYTVKVVGTEFIVAYDPAKTSMQVIGVHGRASLANRVHPDRETPVGASELIPIAPDGSIGSVVRLSDADLQQWLDRFEFVGAGRLEGLGYPLLPSTPPSTGRALGEWRYGLPKDRLPYDQPPAVLQSIELPIRFN